MSTTLGPVGYAQFNSNFMYYIAIIILIVAGYLWGKNTGVQDEKKKSKK